MINLTRVILIFLLTLISPLDNNITHSICTESKQDTIAYTYKIVDPTSVNHFGLTDRDNLILFIKYIKTQSNRIDNELGRSDVYYVIQTMLNRLRVYEVDWITYYKHEKINNSQSIKRMKSGDLRPSFSMDDAHDQVLIAMVYSSLYGFIDSDLKLDNDVLYFHSFGEAYDRKPHSQSNFHTEARHRFYCK